MGGSASVIARFLALAFFIVAGMGIYLFMVNTDLEAAKVKLAEVEKERDTYSLRVKQYQAESKGSAEKAQQCDAQLKEVQAQLEAASKRGGRR